MENARVSPRIGPRAGALGTLRRMLFDERRKRSEVRQEALQYLVESVLDRSDVSCAAIVDARARMVAGAGRAEELALLARVANDVARGDVSGLDEEDVLARAVDAGGETLVLAAVGCASAACRARPRRSRASRDRRAPPRGEIRRWPE